MTTTRRRLSSLQPQVEAYVRKAWYTVPSAHASRGVNANAPREPGYFGTSVRLAARVVDELVGGHPANLGACDCPPCGCEFAPHEYEPCVHDQLCPHTGGRDDQPGTVSARLLKLMARLPHLRGKFAKGLEAVYEAADLTIAEADVARYRHRGVSYASIARIRDCEVGTVKALDSRSHKKLRALAVPVRARRAA